MKLQYKLFIVFLVALVLFKGTSEGNVWAQAKVSAKIDAKQIEIGDQFHLFLAVELPDNAGKVTWANIPAIQGIDIVDTGTVDSVKNGKTFIYKQKLSLTGFDSGIYSIPPFDFILTEPSGNIQHLLTDSFSIQVKTLAVDTLAPIKPIKDIIEVEKDWLSYWPYFLLALCGFVILVVLIIWLIKKIKKRKNTPKVIETPDQKANRLLSQLKTAQFDGEDGQKQYYSILTQVLKDYIEERYGISIAEMTTDELLKTAKNNPDLRQIRTEMKQVFRTADLAKFAKAKPGNEEQEMSMDAALQMVRKTKQVVVQEGLQK